MLMVMRAGRPHQIRIHMACIGHPLVGEPLYAPGGRPQQPGVPPGAIGYCLHAWQVELQHPVHRTWVVVEAPAPKWAATLL